MTVPFNRPPLIGKELDYLREALEERCLQGGGTFTRACQTILEAMTGCSRALLTHSCTAALEISALLCRLGPGDEVIMPSYTFVSTANAVALRGATPVFVDIRPDTLNLDDGLVEGAITERTKAIFAVHYAGVGCAPARLRDLADERNLILVEDAAQGLCAAYDGRPLGSFGQLAAISFHATKNIVSGEGGALLVNAPELVERAEVILEKGTNRGRFLRGQADKYTWIDLGSSYQASELTAAFLKAQLEQAQTVTDGRLAVWNRYHEGLADLEEAGLLRRPVVPEGCAHNAHLYYVILPSRRERDAVLSGLKTSGVEAQFHYIPLHTSPAGRAFGRPHGELAVATDMAARLVRLPLWYGMTEEVERVLATLRMCLRRGITG